MSEAFLDQNTNDQLLFKNSTGRPSTNETKAPLKQHYHPVHRTSTCPIGLSASAAIVRARGSIASHSVLMTKEFRTPPCRPTKSQSPTNIPRRLAPSHPHPKSAYSQNATSADGPKRQPRSHTQLLSIPHPVEANGQLTLQYPQASVTMNHWQDMLDADRNFDSLPPSVFQKVQKRITGGQSPVQGILRHHETHSSRKMSLDTHLDADDSSAMNLTFCGAGEATTVLTEDPPGVGSPRTIAQYTVDDHLLGSSESEQPRPRLASNGCDIRVVRNQSVEEINIQHNGTQQLIVEEEEDYPLFQATTQVVTPSALAAPKLMYNLPPQLIATGGGGAGNKVSPPYTQGARNLNYKEYRPKGSRATAQTIQATPSSWDRYLIFSSDETAILTETRRILFEGIRLHSRIAAECDCTTPIREKALDDLKKSLGVIQALPPLDANCFLAE